MRIPQVGETFGPYRVERLLGRGGMGAVFVANQIALSRPVALKVLLPQLADSEDYRRRFGREASALASAQSPHIVPIFDYGEIEGALFIATQLVPGGDLGARLKNTPMEQAFALDVARDVARGLADAHQVGVLHRDVKPSNVLIWDRQEGPHAYLCDFGIAKIEGSEHTSTEGIVGTWAFLSPERCNGAPASEASDIYSAGCVLWNMLTGATPYSGTSVEMAMAHVVKPVPQLTGDTDAVHQINQILSRSMAKDPSDRYRSAGEMAREISRVRAQIPNSAGAGEGSAAPGVATIGGSEASEYRTARLSPTDPQPEERPTHRFRNVLIATLAVLVASALAGWVAVAQGWVSSDQDPASGRGSSNGPSENPTLEDPTAICWNGEPAAVLSDCSNPEGVEGLAWAFPSFDVDDPACQEAPPTLVAKSNVFSCESSFRGTTVAIRYSAWKNVQVARRHYSRVYPDEPVQVRSTNSAPRFVWRDGPSEDEPFPRLSTAYVEWPFSVSIDAETIAAREWGFRQVTFRPEAQMTGVRKGS